MDLARLLLPHVGDHPEAAAVLFGAARDLNYITAPELPDDVVLATIKQPVSRAEAVVPAVRNPQVLAALTGDARLRVRRRVAANKHTPASALVKIWDAALRKDDTETLGIVAVHPRIPIDAIAPTWDQAMARLARYERQSYLAPLVHRVLDSSDAELVTLVASTGSVELVGPVLAAAQTGLACGLGLDDIVAAVPSAVLDDVVAEAMVVATQVDLELAKLFVTHSSWDLLVERQANSAHTAIWRHEVPDGRLTLSALLLLLPTGRAGQQVTPEALDWLGASAAPTGGETHLMSEALDIFAVALTTSKVSYTPGLRGIREILGRHGHLMDAALCTKLLGVADSSLAKQGGIRLLEAAGTHIPADASTDLVHALIERRSLHTLAAFISGECDRKPAPGEIAAWAANDEPSLYLVSSTTRPALLASAVYASKQGASVLDKPWCSEVLDGIGDELVRTMAQNDPVAQYVTEQVTQRLGDDPEAWATFLSLAGDLGAEPLSELLDAVCTLVPGATQPV